MEEKDRADMKALVEQYAEEMRLAPMRVREERDAAIRALVAERGLRPVDVEKSTGFSRETVRQILRPQTRPAPKSVTVEPVKVPKKATKKAALRKAAAAEE